MVNRRQAELARPDPGNRSTSPTPTRSETSSSSKASSPTEQQKSQIDFQFLNFSHPSDAKALRARRTVRSHVTKQQHQREHAAAAARKAKSSQSSPTEQDDIPQLSRASTTTSQGSSRRPSSPELPPQPGTATSSPEASSPSSPFPTDSHTYLAEARIDAADYYPEEWLAHIGPSMEHYLIHMAANIPNLTPPNTDPTPHLRARFYPLILSDPASMHAATLMAAAHYGSVRGPASHRINLLQLRGMAIREINSALEEPARATSDALVVAVAQMAAYEALFGDRRIFNTHMTGLLRVVSLRGGLPALGPDGLLERMLLWIDSNAARCTGSHLYFDRAAFPSRVEHPVPDVHGFAGGGLRRGSSA